MLSWNVNGLVRKLTDTNFLDYVNDYQILLLTETWIGRNNVMNLEINGYSSEHVFGNKSPGCVKGRYSGGISLYVKDYLKDRVKVIDKNSAGLLWLKIDSDLFDFKEDVFICSTYIPPSDSRVFISSDCNYWEEIEKGIESYSSLGKVYVTGDMNGRTSDFPDILDFDRYLEDNDLYAEMSHVPLRVNQDHFVDQHDRKLLELCKSSGFIIANGRLDDERILGT